MGQITLQIPQSGQLFSTEGPKVASGMTAIQTVINGNLDTTNLTAAVSQSAGVNAGGVVVKGATSIAASESRTNVAYGTLTTPDQVTGIVLPGNGLIQVWYQATWQESVSGAARAALFISGNQLVVGSTTVSSGPVTSAAATNFGGTNQAEVLSVCPVGLISIKGGAYTGDVTTGQAVGLAVISDAGAVELGGTVRNIGSTTSSSMVFGGPCCIFASAGTYSVAVQFKASSGSVTAANRKLWVQALSFA